MTPKFLCENCKTEVSARDRVCPKCGRFFSDVRCPRCNFTGAAEVFYAGCPQCGYLDPAFQAGGAAVEILDPAIFETDPSPETPREKQPPPWFFLALTIGLGIILAVLVYLLINK
jgi:hypothetical protein